MKILIISQNTTPLQTPRAFRTAELSEQLAKLGHEVVLYTIHGGKDYSDYERQSKVKMRDINTRFLTISNVGVVRYSFVDRVLNKLLHRLIFYPQIELAFKVPQIIKSNPNFDLLITIAYPHSIHLGAYRAKRKFPELFPKVWVADCGDPFCLNPFFNFPKYMRKFEKKWCAACNNITIPTEQGRDGYFKQYRDKIVVIPQGFNFEKTPIDEYVGNDVPTFVFTGSVYPNVRDPRSFMDYLLTCGYKYKFKLYMRTPLEEKYVRESNGQIEYIIGAERAEIIKECSKADFLINVVNPSVVQSPSKLIDYGIANRPILNISTLFTEKDSFLEFLHGDYHNQYFVERLDSYRIENVAQQFLDLTKN